MIIFKNNHNTFKLYFFLVSGVITITTNNFANTKNNSNNNNFIQKLPSKANILVYQADKSQWTKCA